MPRGQAGPASGGSPPRSGGSGGVTHIHTHFYIGGRVIPVELALLGAFFPGQAIWFIMVPVMGSSLFTVGYSYYVYQRELKA